MPSSPVLSPASGRLLIYNPDHDEALAANTPYYTPTKAAQKQMSAWAEQRLPWQQAGDAVWHYTEKVNWATVQSILPFGWDAALCTRLLRAGAPVSLLPDAQQLSAIRRLSSRQTAVQLLPLLRDRLPQSFGVAFWVTEREQAAAYQKQYGNIVLKSPWSCAGRGVFRWTTAQDTDVCTRIDRILRTQGGIVVEPFYEHTHDFALELHYQNGVATVKGLNVFATQDGRFMGNIARESLSLPRTLLLTVAEQLCDTLPLVLHKDYEGPLGVDMMTNAKGQIHPCVEINLRRTMGRMGSI